MHELVPYHTVSYRYTYRVVPIYIPCCTDIRKYTNTCIHKYTDKLKKTCARARTCLRCVCVCVCGVCVCVCGVCVCVFAHTHTHTHTHDMYINRIEGANPQKDLFMNYYYY